MTYEKCQKLKLSDVEGDRSIYDFLSAVESISPDFTSFWTNQMELQNRQKTLIPAAGPPDTSNTQYSLVKIIELY